jgi:hypothetical protein
MMAVGEDARIANHVHAGPQDESGKLGEELLGTHVEVRGTAWQVQTNASIREPLHGVVGKWRTNQIPRDAFEPFAITTIDHSGSVQTHAEGGDVEARMDDLFGPTERRSRQSKLNTARETRVDVCVVGHPRAEVAVHSLKNASEVFVTEVGQKAESSDVAGLFFKGAVGDQRVQMNEQAEVGAKPLHYDDNAWVHIPGNGCIPARNALHRTIGRWHAAFLGGW